MATVLVLGAGMVTRPMVRYILENTDFNLRMASRTVSKAVAMIDGHPRGEAVALDVSKDMEALEPMVKEADLVVSLLPYAYHVAVAEFCIKHKKHMVTTSYVSDAMKALDGRAKEAGITILNEIGLDPGIDHMSAMRVIHDVQKKGGRISNFRSSCGALPAKDVRQNPFGYKFSWSPRGVILASRNAAKWQEDNKEVSVPGEKLFENYIFKTVEGVGVFENYPNRNSVPYKDIYGIQDTDTIYRGTLRNFGWCETMRKIAGLGYLKEEETPDIADMTYNQLLGKLIGKEGKATIQDLANTLGVDTYSTVAKRLEWLGLLSDEKVPAGSKSPLDVLATRMLEMLEMEPGEKDMVVLYHEFEADYGDRKEFITSTLVDIGIPNGDSAIARTVSLPAAMAVKLIIEGKIATPGVHVPVIPEIYGPVLKELEELSIICREEARSM